MISKKFPAKPEYIAEANDFLVEYLENRTISDSLMFEYQLLVEEINLKLISVAPEGSEIEIRASSSGNHCHIRFACPGAPVNLFLEEDSIGSVILDEYRERISQSYRNKKNCIKLTTSTASDRTLKYSSVAVLLAVLTFIFLTSAVDKSSMQYVSENITMPIIQAFVNILGAIAMPVAALSICSYIISFRLKIEANSDMIKTAVSYSLLSLVSLALGCACAYLTNMLVLGRVNIMVSMGQENNFLGNSFSGIVEKAIPTNIIEPFLASNPIPLLVLAILMGVAASSFFGQGADTIRDGIFGFEGLLIRLLNMVYNVIPVWVYFSVLDGLISSGWPMLLRCLGILAGMFTCLAILFLLLMLALAVNGISPVRFIKEHKDLIIENFRIASSFDSLSYNRRTMHKKFGISSLILKDKLDLGALMDMCGNSTVISYVIFAALHMCGASFSVQEMITIMVVIILLSMGAPNHPGSFLLCMFILLNFTGVSNFAIGTPVICEAFSSKAYTFMNVFGDIVVVLASEKQKRSRKSQK